ncbi:MAG TPA: hypothetical protein VIQ81_12930 [Gammaproteobacteria bacterium]
MATAKRQSSFTASGAGVGRNITVLSQGYLKSNDIKVEHDQVSRVPGEGKSLRNILMLKNNKDAAIQFATNNGDTHWNNIKQTA